MTKEKSTHVSNLTASQLDKRQKRLLSWIRGLCCDGSGYRQSDTTAASDFTQCFAIMVAYQNGLLKSLLPTKDERKKVAAHLQSLQDKETGCFVYAPLRANPKALNRRDTYTTWQLGYFVTVALKILKTKPLYPLKYLEFLCLGEQNVRHWLNSLDWQNPWTESNLVMFALSGLWHDYQQYGEERYLSTFHQILDWHDNQQSSDSGYWGAGIKSAYYHGLYGAYHQYLFYFCCGRRLPHLERIIDRTLLLQKNTGLFSPAPGSGACQDMDAVVTLVGCAMRTDYRRQDILYALSQYLTASEKMEHPQGGMLWSACLCSTPATFLSFIRDFFQHRRPVLFLLDNAIALKALLAKKSVGRPNYERWTDKDIPLGEPDLFSTFARIDALRCIATLLNNAKEYECCKPMPMPGLGCDITPVSTDP